MAILDPRLLPFIEMLADLGMDWLVFELVDGIRRGDEPEEDEEALALARQPTKRRPADDLERHARIWRTNTDESGDSVPTSILGDRQLQWAADYVSERLHATLAEMSQSLRALDEIFKDPEVEQPEASAGETLLVLIDDGEEREVDRAKIEDAQERLLELRKALDAWRRSASPGLDQ